MKLSSILITAAWLAFFLSLVYLQLRFYREGDRKKMRNGRKLPAVEVSPAPSRLKSPLQRAIWENQEQTRALMRHKEDEFLREQRIKEQRSLGLPRNEEILFMADRSALYFWPAGLCSALFLLIASLPSELPTAFSFSFLLLGLSGLLLLTAAKSHTRYYVTDFRILAKTKLPLAPARWSILHFPRVFLLSRKRKFVWEEIIVGSDEGTIRISGLTKRKLEVMLDVLQKRMRILDCQSRIKNLQSEIPNHWRIS